MNQSIKKLNIIGKKRRLEHQLTEWIHRKPEERNKYAGILTELEDSYRNRYKNARAMAYFGECFANGPELVTAAWSVLNFDFEAEKSVLEERVRQLLELYANIDLDIDKKVFVAMLKEYAAVVEPESLSETYATIEKKFKGDYQAYVDDLYSHTELDTPHGFERVVKKDSTYVLFEDPAISFVIDMLVKSYELSAAVDDDNMKIEKNERLLNEAVREMESDKDFYPDANSTMRFSFGMIGGYSPKDALEYTYYTTTKGIFDKIREYKGDSDFEVIPSVIDLLENRDFGRYAAEDGNMNVCFISDNDITGGNSGSGMFNGNGELIGLAFDGNWEAMSSDIIYEPNLQRCIGVDIRYVLYMIEKYGKSTRLINELKLVE